MTLLVLAFGAVLVVAAFAWSLCRMAADADRRVEGRCARCNEPVVGRQLFCDAGCQLLWETCP